MPESTYALTIPYVTYPGLYANSKNISHWLLVSKNWLNWQYQICYKSHHGIYLRVAYFKWFYLYNWNKVCTQCQELPHKVGSGKGILLILANSDLQATSRSTLSLLQAHSFLYMLKLWDIWMLRNDLCMLLCDGYFRWVWKKSFKHLYLSLLHACLQLFDTYKVA